MSPHHPDLRTILKFVIAGAIGLLVIATAHAKSPLPPLTGNWTGEYKVRGEHGPDARGTVTGAITQTASDGTMLGTAISTDGQVSVSISGDFTLVRRKLTGFFDLTGDVVDTATFKGKANGSGDRLKLKLRPATGGKVKITLDRAPAP